MQSQLASADPDIATAWTEASDVLGYDLWALAQAGPQERLDETVVTQPAMLTAGYAAWQAWNRAGGPLPQFMAGHSLGEYTALVCAGALAFPAAVGLVQKRAELMQSAVPAGDGAMAALLGLDDESVSRVCAEQAQGEVVNAVNFNAPGQVVIAGDKAAVERATAAAKDAGAKRAIMLSVSVPSHCSLMSGAGEELAAVLDSIDISTPQIPVISNVDVKQYEDAAGIRDGLRRQLSSPVRWVETIQHMAAAGVSQVVECGPGKVLAGLLRRIDRSLAGGFVDSAESMRDAISAASNDNKS